MIVVISACATIIGLAAAIDRVLLDTDKAKIVGYLGNHKDFGFPDFESVVVSGAISLLLDRRTDKLSLVKVALYTLVGTFIITATVMLLVLVALFNHIESDDINILNIFAYMIGAFIVTILVAYCSFPSDWISLYITKKLFWNKVRHPLVMFPLWILDFFVSLFVAIFPLFLIYNSQIIELDMSVSNKLIGSEEASFFMIGFLCSGLLSVGISVFFLFVILIGFCLRAVNLFQYNFAKFLLQRTAVSLNPVTCISAVGSVVLIAICFFFFCIYWAYSLIVSVVN